MVYMFCVGGRLVKRGGLDKTKIYDFRMSLWLAGGQEIENKELVGEGSRRRE